MMGDHIIPHSYQITKTDREKLSGHRGILLWFTGLSGSGKSTIANKVEHRLYEQRIHTYVLDGDNIRKGINKDLSFSPKDRSENIRRIAEVANLMIEAGLVVLAAFVSPYKTDREAIKTIVGADNIVEIYVKAPVEVCEQRDVKGLYAKARQGEIKNMTGISAPYEAPERPDLELKTAENNVEDLVAMVLDYTIPKLKL